MGTDFGDYDGDGDLDLFVTNHELEAHTLFRNLGKGLFEDTTFPSGVGTATLPYVGFGAVFVDYDNDADLDLGIVNGHVMNSPGHVRPGATEAQRKLLLRNAGGGRLTDVGRQSGPGFARRRSAARWSPATSTTTATSICSSPTTAATPNCCATRAARATARC